MPKVNYNSSSPYFLTPQNSSYMGLWVPRVIPVLNTDTPLTILKIHEFKPDLLAYDLYQDSKLWWVFAVRNKDIIKDPIWGMKEGTKIMITQPEALKSLLNA